MKKSVLLFLTIMLIFIVFSCSESDQVLTLDQAIPKSESHVISKDMAIQTAIKALINLDKSTKGSTRNVSKDWKVNTLKYYKSKQTRSSVTNNDTLFYILNFKEGGFAIVPTDNRASDVYALSLEDSLDIENNEGVAFYMSLATDYLNTELECSVGLLPFVPIPEDGDPSLYMITEYNGMRYYTHYVDWANTTTPFYLLSTSWSQNGPYNNMCFTWDGLQAKAGCVAIAMGQIMAYHRKPESYDGHTYLWNEILRYPFVFSGTAAASSVAYLVNDIGRAVYMDYGVIASGASSSACVPGFQQFGYTSSALNNYNLSAVISSLRSSSPVLIGGLNSSGDGHSWVLDGYYNQHRETSYYTLDTKELYHTDYFDRTYLHCNWGGGSNGYFLSGAFNDYNTNVMVVTNITFN